MAKTKREFYAALVAMLKEHPEWDALSNGAVAAEIDGLALGLGWEVTPGRVHSARVWRDPPPEPEPVDRPVVVPLMREQIHVKHLKARLAEPALAKHRRRPEWQAELDRLETEQ